MLKDFNTIFSEMKFTMAEEKDNFFRYHINKTKSTH